MRILKTLILAVLMAFPWLAEAQIPAPQINLSGNIGCQGFPCLNNGTLIMASDANRTMTALETSAFYIKVTSSVSLTATRNLIAPVGRFMFTIENATTGGQSIQIIGASGTGVTVANGTTVGVWNDGTNFVQIGSAGGSGGSNVQVNGGSTLTNANLNGTTPAAGAGSQNVTWQNSGANVSAEVPFATNSIFGLIKPDNTSCTVAAGVLTCPGSGGYTPPTGNGFVHITSGAQDSVARAVDLSSADATGTLAAGRFPAQTGDVTNTAGSLATTVGRVAGVIYPASPASTNLVPVVTTAGGSPAVTYEQVPNAALLNPSTTVNSQTCILGSTCTVTAAPSGAAGGALAGTYPNPTITGLGAQYLMPSSTGGGGLLASNIATDSTGNNLTSLSGKVNFQYLWGNPNGLSGLDSTERGFLADSVYRWTWFELLNTACGTGPNFMGAAWAANTGTTENTAFMGHLSPCNNSDVVPPDTNYFVGTGAAHQQYGTSIATITNVSLTSNVVTITAANSYSIGQYVIVFNLTGASFLNNQPPAIILSASSTQFTYAFTHASYGPASDAGSAEIVTENLISIGMENSGTVNIGGAVRNPQISLREGLNPNGIFFPQDSTGGIYYGDVTSGQAQLSHVTLTTTGSSGPATFIGGTLNIPQYSGGGTPTIIQVNGTPTSTATPVNLQTSTANSVGLTITPSNPSVGNVKLEITGGTYTGTAANVTGIVAIANGGTGAATAATHTVFGNPTGGTAAPSFTNAPVVTSITAGTNLFNSTGINTSGNDFTFNISSANLFLGVASGATVVQVPAGNTFELGALSGCLGADATTHIVTGSGICTTSTSLTSGFVPKASGANSLVTSTIQDTGSVINLTEPVFGTNLNASGTVLGTTGISGPVNVCADTSGSGTAQVCSTATSFTPAAGACVAYTTTTTNSGAGLTLNVNSLGAKSVGIAGASGWTTTLTASIIPANKPATACYDGTNWNVMQTGTASSGGGTPAYPLTVTGCVSGGVLYGSSPTQVTCSTAGTAGQAMLWGGAGVAPTAKVLAGTGTGLVTGPTTSVTTDLLSYTGTGGQSQDSGIASANVALLNGTNQFTGLQSVNQSNAALDLAGFSSFNSSTTNNSSSSFQCETRNSSFAAFNACKLTGKMTSNTAGSEVSTVTLSNWNAGAAVNALVLSGAGNALFLGAVTSALGNAAITSATGATGVTSVTCQTAACNVSRGSYTVVGGTATTGTIVTLLWPTTTTAWVCSVDMNGGTGFLGLGHSVATATGMTVSAGVTVVGTTFTFDYSCIP